jgi:hypothetical protein
MIPHQQRDEIVAEIRRLFPENYAVPDERCACLYWAGATLQYLQQNFEGRFVLQAGTAMYRRCPRELDDTEKNTHYGYEFEANAELTYRMLMINSLPEMHVWCADVGSLEIIDLTTRYVPALCERAGVAWINGQPPDYVWGNEEFLERHDMHYHADVSACVLAYLILKETPGGKGREMPAGYILRRWAEEYTKMERFARVIRGKQHAHNGRPGNGRCGGVSLN